MPDPVRSLVIPSGGIGMPDYSQPKPTGTVSTGQIYSVQDIGELAARMGSPVRYDRRGYTVVVEDFRNGIKGWDATAFITPTIKWVAGVNDGSGFACEFRGVSGYCQLHKPMFRPFSGYRAGIETNYRLVDRGSARAGDWMNANLAVSSPTVTRNFYARVNMITDKLQIQSGGLGVYVDIADANNAYGMVHHIKVVGNWGTGKFERVMYDGQEYDVSEYPGYDGPGAYHYIGFGVQSNSAVPFEHLVCSIIGTVSEPENEAP